MFMFLNRLVLLALVVLMVAGCTASSKMNDLKLGMTRDQVIETLGKPTSTSENEDALFLNYKLFDGGVFREPYYVRLTNEKVDAFGQVGDFNLGY